MNPLFDRRTRESFERVDAALTHAAADWRRSPSPELRGRILASIDASPRPRLESVRRPLMPRATLWLALAASCLIAWLAWQARSSSLPSGPPVADGAGPSVHRTVVHVSAESLVRQAWAQLTAPSIARSLDRPLVAEVGHMRADAQRAVDFLVARVSLPAGTRAHGD